MFETRNEREKRMDRRKESAKRQGVRFLLVVFDYWSKTEAIIEDSQSLTPAEAILRAAPIKEMKVVSQCWDLRPPPVENLRGANNDANQS